VGERGALGYGRKKEIKRQIKYIIKFSLISTPLSLRLKRGHARAFEVHESTLEGKTLGKIYGASSFNSH
jgi:hypothetical protein